MLPESFAKNLKARFWVMASQVFFSCSLAGVPCLAANQEVYRAEYVTSNVEGVSANLQQARQAFSVYTGADASVKPRAAVQITRNLLRAGFPQTATYFFLQGLRMGDVRSSIGLLEMLPEFLTQAGPDVLQNDVLHFAQSDGLSQQLSPRARNFFHYFLGKNHLFHLEAAKALEVLKRVNPSEFSSMGSVAPSIAHLRATAHALLNQTGEALQFFELCESLSSKKRSTLGDDVKFRCLAGKARVLYQMGKFDDAEDVYDDIPKRSLVWTDILFEQAWNAFSKNDHNRALGKLVSYNSPMLEFVFNPEVDSLRAQVFLDLCLYDDANRTINNFNRKYYSAGLNLKDFITQNKNDLLKFYGRARQSALGRLHTTDSLTQIMNRFAKGPYFMTFISQERALEHERAKLRLAFSGDPNPFEKFLVQAQNWRLRSVRLLGGALAYNALVDQYRSLLEDFDKVSFIKGEMLSKMKGKLARQNAMATVLDEDGKSKRGTDETSRKDYQYYWKFNGEFWLDELGDYVFALKPECEGARL